MGKLEIKIIDSLFGHVPTVGSTSTSCSPSNFTWNRNKHDDYLTVFTDNDLEKVKHCTSRYKIAWLVESPLITNAHVRIIELEQYFDKIITFNEELLKRNKKYCFYALGGCWIEETHRKIYDKDKLVSIITSNKNATVGQKLRNSVVNNFKNRMDLYGRGYFEIPYKLESLKSYYYSVVIENCSSNFYFSEKLIDCLVCGTIPIYYGCDGIVNYFDKRGMILFNNINDLEVILNDLTIEKYNSMLEYVKINFEKAKQYCIIEDSIWVHLKEFF